MSTFPVELRLRMTALMDRHLKVADLLHAASEGTDALIGADWKGTLDTDIACLVLDIRKHAVAQS